MLALRDQDPRAYDRLGRWVLAAAVLVGWGIGAAVATATARKPAFASAPTTRATCW